MKITVIICLFIIALCSAIDLNERSVQGDEFGSIWLGSQESASYVIKKIYETDVHSPAHYLFLHYFGKVFGYSDFAMRFPSVLFVLFSLIVGWRLVGLLSPGKSHREKLTIFLLCSTAPALWVLGSVARHYLAGMLLGLLSYYIYLRWYREGSIRLLVGTVLLTAALFYFHYLLAPMIAVGQGLHYLINIRAKNLRERIIWIISQVSVIIIFMPIFLWNIAPVLTGESRNLINAMAEGVSGIRGVPFFFLGQIYTALSGGVPYPWEFWVTIPLVGAFILLTYKGFKEKVLWNREAFFLLYLPYFLMTIIIALMVPVTGYFYGIFRVGPLALLFWIFLGQAVVSIEVKRIQLSIIVIILICNFYSIFVYNYNLPSMLQGPPINDMSRFIAEETPTGRSVSVFNPFPHGWGDPISRYLPRDFESRILMDGSWGLTIDSAERLIAGKNPEDIWVIEANRFKQKTTLLCEWLINNGYSLKLEKDFQRQSPLDIWFKEIIKRISFFGFKSNPSYRYKYTIKNFTKLPKATPYF